jgi:hypothetical protein
MADRPACLAHLHLALVPGSDPISGSVTGPDGVPEDVHGWIELTCAIQRALDRSPAPEHQEDHA